MNKILRKLAGVFGASPIPQAGLNAQLMMDKYLLGIQIQLQHGLDVRTMYKALSDDGISIRSKPIGIGFSRKTDRHPVLLQSTPFCHVVKAGFKKSVIRIHKLELLVENKYIKQPESITKSV